MIPGDKLNATNNVAKQALIALAMLCFGVISGCATNPNAPPHDPWESWNRKVSNFNEGVDTALAKPIAMAYKEVTPQFFRTGVSNFFSNLTDPWTVINSVLQLKGQAAVESLMRFSVNTVFGLGGLLDIASEMNIEKHKADFGQTLGHWGVQPGPYLVLPLLGPSTLRDTLASTLIARGDPVWQLEKVATRNSLYAFRWIDKRANLLRTTAVLDEFALDKYSFTRDIFLQIRRNEMFDGNAPDEVLRDSEKPEAKPEAKPEVKLKDDAEGEPELSSDVKPEAQTTATLPLELVK